MSAVMRVARWALHSGMSLARLLAAQMEPLSVENWVVRMDLR